MIKKEVKKLDIISRAVAVICAAFLLIAYFGVRISNGNAKIVHNIDMQIVSINGQGVLKDNQYYKTNKCNVILLQTISDVNIRYREINTCSGLTDIKIDSEWIYNHKVGDTIHFDYLMENKFFKINIR